MPNSSSQPTSSRYRAVSSTMSPRSRSDQRSAGASARACEPTTSSGPHVLALLGPVRHGRLEQLHGRVRVRQEPCVELDRALVHAAERELAVRDALVQLRQHRPRVDARQRAGLWHRLGLDQAPEQRRRHAWGIDGQNDARHTSRHARPRRRRTRPPAPRRRRRAPGTGGRARPPPCRRRSPPRRPRRAAGALARRASRHGTWRRPWVTRSATTLLRAGARP